MDILDPNQLGILQGVRAGKYLGAVPLEQLRSDVDLMLELRLIEPSGACPYRLTTAGAQILTLATDACSQGRPR
jgi:hypothetical protein